MEGAKQGTQREYVMGEAVSALFFRGVTRPSQPGTLTNQAINPFSPFKIYFRGYWEVTKFLGAWPPRIPLPCESGEEFLEGPFPRSS